MLKVLIVLAIGLTAVAAFADDDHQFHRGRGGFRGNERSERPGRFQAQRPSYGGNGCPAGTMSLVFAPDNLSFTVLFDRFVADTASRDQGVTGAMSCDVLIPIALPAGQQMEITRVDYRGFASVPQGGRGTLTSSFNFVESGRGAWRDRDRINVRYAFDGPLSENYEISTGDLGGGRNVPQTEVSPCGGEARLRIRNSVRVTAPRGQSAQITLDSIDGSSNAVYYLNWRSCAAPGPGRGEGSDRGRDRDEGRGPRR